MAMPVVAVENKDKPMTDKQKLYIEKMVNIGKKRGLYLGKPANYPNINREEASKLIDALQTEVFPDNKSSAKRKQIDEIDGKAIFAISFYEAIDRLNRRETVYCRMAAHYDWIEYKPFEVSDEIRINGARNYPFSDFIFSLNQATKGQWGVAIETGNTEVKEEQEKEEQETGFSFKKGISKKEED